MRISDWSSDVCSSDLPHRLPAPALRAGLAARPAAAGLDRSADDPPAGEILSRRMSGGVVAEGGREQITVSSCDVLKIDSGWMGNYLFDSAILRLSLRGAI